MKLIFVCACACRQRSIGSINPAGLLKGADDVESGCCRGTCCWANTEGSYRSCEKGGCCEPGGACVAGESRDPAVFSVSGHCWYILGHTEIAFLI